MTGTESTREIGPQYITLFSEEGLGLFMRCHHCHDEYRLGFGDWTPGELTTKAAKHYCGGGWL